METETKAEAEVPRLIMEIISGRNVTLSIMMEEGTIINVDGLEFSNNIPMLQIGEKNIMNSSVWSEVVSNLETKGHTEENIKAVQISSDNVAVESKLTLFANMSKYPVGTKTSLYFVDEKGELILFRKSIVFKNGYTAFEVPFAAANYIVVAE